MKLKQSVARILGIDGVPILLACIAVTFYFSLIVPSFFRIDALRFYLNEDAPLFIVTAGLALVIIAGGIDLSVGAVLGLSAGMSLYASMNGLNTPLSALVGIATGFAFGAVNGFLIVKWRLNDFIVTLGTLNVAAGLLVVLTDHVQITGTGADSYLSIANTRIVGVTSGMLIALVAIAILHIILVRTVLGRKIMATGLGAEPALIAGIDVGRIKYSAYIISGSLAGLGGVVLASRLNSAQPGLAGGYELSAIAAAVLGGVSLAGGRGGIWQAAMGAFLLVTLRQGFRLMGVDPLIFSIITGVCILAGVILDRGVRRLALSMAVPASTHSDDHELFPVGEAR